MSQLKISEFIGSSKDCVFVAQTIYANLNNPTRNNCFTLVERRYCTDNVWSCTDSIRIPHGICPDSAMNPINLFWVKDVEVTQKTFDLLKYIPEVKTIKKYDSTVNWGGSGNYQIVSPDSANDWLGVLLLIYLPNGATVWRKYNSEVELNQVLDLVPKDWHELPKLFCSAVWCRELELSYLEDKTYYTIDR